VTIFLQQLGRGLRLHPDKAHVTVLDFIGNYRRAHQKVPVLLGLEPETPPRDVARALEGAIKGTWAGLPPGVELHLDWQAVDLLKAMIARGEPRREALVAAYREVEEAVGHTPTLLEMQRWGRFGVRTYRQEFRSWHNFLAAIDALDSAHRQLEAEVGSFLVEVEATAMTRSFKMVVLEAFVRRGGLERPVSIDSLVEDFRSFFVSSPGRRRDLGPEVSDLEAVAPDRLRAYVMSNPLAAWTGAGTRSQRATYFTLEGDALLYTGPAASASELFREAVLARTAWRLADHFERRYERRDVYNVIHAAGDRGIIQLGDGTRKPFPQGWLQVRVGDRLWWAKVAKVAINVLKDHPTDGPSPPNRLTEVLEELFGPGGYRSTHRNRVRITPGEDDVWVIEPVRTPPA
jgi:hypothetical protein